MNYELEFYDGDRMTLNGESDEQVIEFFSCPGGPVVRIWKDGVAIWERPKA